MYDTFMVNFSFTFEKSINKLCSARHMISYFVLNIGEVILEKAFKANIMYV